MTVIFYNSQEDTCLKGKLDYYYKIIKNQILKFQHPVSGLFPLDPGNPKCKYSHIRDSIYCATAVWALRQCFGRVDNDEGRHYELGQSVVKCMRAILIGWMQQSSRLELFKKNQSMDTSLHSCLDYETGEPIYGDNYKNLQIDCVSLFVIQLTQMISSGLEIVFTKDEVAFVQNLIFYLERAYRISDYGMWERGTKQNRNITELHASSIGMAKSALESVSGFNIYGSEGGHAFVLYIDVDAHSRNRSILDNLLPRESASKGSDAALIPTICWPAYAIGQSDLKPVFVERCVKRLKGNYGLRRFNRDGFATLLDTNTEYQPGELMKFANIESEWPMFFCYLIIDYCMFGERDKALEYNKLVQSLLVQPVTEIYPWLPKFFYVPLEDMEEERAQPGSVKRRSNFSLDDEPRFLWGQSVYIISQLLLFECLTSNDLDPLGRCPCSRHRPQSSLIYQPTFFVKKDISVTIQMVLISESVRLQQILATYGVITQTPNQVEPIQIWPPDQLIRVGQFMGCSDNLGLSGRPNRPVGSLGTSRYYRISGLTVLCYPLLFEVHDHYLRHDIQVVIDDIKTDFLFLSESWRQKGRPTYCFLIREDIVKARGFDKFLRFLVSMKNGTISEARLVLGRAQRFVSSGCVEHLDFLPLWTARENFFQRLDQLDAGRSYRSLDNLPKAIDVSSQAKRLDSNIFDNCDEVIQCVHALDKSIFRHSSDDELIKQIVEFGESSIVFARRVAALHELSCRHGLDYSFLAFEKTKIVREVLSEILHKAGIQQHWCIVRMCSALLAQFANNLAPSVSNILVCGKEFSIGVVKVSDEFVVNKPMTPSKFYELLRDCIYRHDPIQFALQQEIILWINSLLTADKTLFTGMKFLRLGWILEAMKLKLEAEMYASSSTSESAIQQLLLPPSMTYSVGACYLYNLAPYKLKDLLLRTLKAGQMATNTRFYCDDDSFGQPYPNSELNVLFQRQLDGCLGRVPPTFYQAVYCILDRSPNGVLICDKLLPQKPILTDMLSYDLNFVDEVESLLRTITNPSYRSLFVEAVMVIAVILERNKELSFKDTVNIKWIIQDAMNSFKNDREAKSIAVCSKPYQRRMSWPDMDIFGTSDLCVYSEFAATPANVHMGTTGYITRTALNCLLQGPIDLDDTNKDACCVM